MSDSNNSGTQLGGVERRVNQGSGSDSTAASVIICYRCNGEGHTLKDCKTVLFCTVWKGYPYDQQVCDTSSTKTYCSVG